MKKISFYFDFISPYAHIAFPLIRKVAKDYKYELETIPVVFGALLNNTGTLGPAEVPSKRSFLWKDVIRISSKYNQTIKGPPLHPFQPLLPLRISSLFTGETQHEVIQKIFENCWEKGNDISNQETISKILKEMNIDPEETISKTQSEDVKLKLKKQTQNAIEKGVFGVPTFIIDGELFWGQDRIDHVIDFINQKDPFHPKHPNFEKYIKLLNEMEKRPRGIDRKIKSKL